jgi:hypothetical protein
MGRYLQRYLPDREVEFISDAGHLWLIEHMGDVLDILLDRKEVGD